MEFIDVFQWGVGRTLVGFLWDTYGLPMSCASDACVVPMGCPLVSCRVSEGFCLSV